jgi:hypothetical protein
VHAAVSSRLGYDPFVPAAPDIVLARIQRRDGALRGEVQLTGADGTKRGAREISVPGDDCSAVLDAIALTISLTLDPAAVLGPPSEAAASAPSAGRAHELSTPVAPPVPKEPQQEANAPAARETTSPLTPSPRAPLAAHIGLGFVGSVGAAPSPSAGAVLFVGGAWRALSVDVEGRADAPATGTGAGAGDASAVRVSTSLLVASVVPCVHLAVAFACPVASGGVLSATARNIQSPRTDEGAFWGAGGRVGAEWPVGFNFAVRGYAEVLAALTRYTLTVDGRPVYQAAPWSASLGVGVAWRSP